MLRTVQPELLDSLPSDHPDAHHSRRDLLAINALMGNHRWFARVLPPLLRPGERVLEIAAGVGELSVRLNSIGINVDALDLCPAPPGWPASRAWHRADLRTFDGYDHYSIFLGNLIFHQFPDAELAGLGERLRRNARLILASEPSRSRLSQYFCRLAGPLYGASHVTRHDARVSIAAGFRGMELARALGLTADAWDLRPSRGVFGASRLIALRRA